MKPDFTYPMIIAPIDTRMGGVQEIRTSLKDLADGSKQNERIVRVCTMSRNRHHQRRRSIVIRWWWWWWWWRRKRRKRRVLMATSRMIKFSRSGTDDGSRSSCILCTSIRDTQRCTMSHILIIGWSGRMLLLMMMMMIHIPVVIGRHASTWRRIISTLLF